MYCRFLDTLPATARPPTASEHGQYQPHLWEQSKLLAALTQWKDDWHIDGQAADGMPLTAEERAMAAGPPVTYFHQDSVTIGGQRFCVAKCDISDVSKISDSVFCNIFMRGTVTTTGRIFFGVLKEIRMFQPVGYDGVHDSHDSLMSSHNQAVLVVDWIAHANRDHRKLHVPIVKAELMSVGYGSAIARYFPAQQYCSPHDVIPTSLVLAPVVASEGNPSGKYYVLHRDAQLSEMSSFSHVRRVR